MTCLAPVAGLALLLGGCGTYGDFGRVRPSLVTDDIHSWVGVEAASAYAQPVSDYRLTEQERLLRDLAFPLIQPSYDRGRFFSILQEYGVTNEFNQDWWYFDVAAYYRNLQAEHHRTVDGRYAKLIEDISNDVERAPAFFDIGARVAVLDERRRKSLAYVTGLTERERDNAMARIGENRLIVGWAAHSLGSRALSYRYALERMVVATPSTRAVQAEVALNRLHDLVALHRAPFPPPPLVTLPSGRIASRRHVSK